MSPLPVVAAPEGGERPGDHAPASIGVTYFYGTNLGANPVGGLVPESATYTDGQRLTFKVPLQIGGGRGVQAPTLVLEAFDRNGVDLSATAIGNQLTVQQLYGDETLAFYSLLLEAQLPSLGGSLKLGRFAAGDDFATWPVYGLAMNSAINSNPLSLELNTGFSTYPDAVWGATAKLAVGGETSLRLGTFQVTDPDVPIDRGFNWAVRPGDGLLLLAQLEHCQGCQGVGWQGQLPRTLPAAVAAVRRAEPSYPVHRQRLALGGYWSLQSQASDEGSAPAPSTYGGWLHLDRILWQAHPGGPTLMAWGALTGSPQPSVVTLPIFWAVGLVHYGLVPSRPQDSGMLALYQGRYSQAFMTSLGSPQSAAAQETVIELGYRRWLGTIAYLQPNLQLVIHPSGLPIPTALVVGLQTGITF